MKFNETKLYIMDLLTKIHNSISFNILFLYSHTPYDKKVDKRFTFYKNQRNLDSIGYFDLDNFTNFCSFNSPKYYNQALRIVNLRLNDLKPIYGLRYYDKLFTYLSFCYFNETISIEILRNQYYKVLNKFIFPHNDVFYNIALTQDFTLLKFCVDYFLEMDRYMNRFISVNRYDRFDFDKEVEYIAVSLGNIKGEYNEIRDMLDNLTQLRMIKRRELFLKRIEVSRHKQYMLKSGRTNKYKNKLLKYNPFINKSNNYDLNLKILTHARRNDLNIEFNTINLRNIENKIRTEIGHYKIGEKWISETNLYYKIKKLLSKSGVDVIHHYRSSFLKDQEIDIYFEFQNYKVGIEYQGRQHFEAIEFFGGEEGFKALEKRDEIKASLCKKNNLKMIYFYYYETIDDELVMKKLNSIFQK